MIPITVEQQEFLNSIGYKSLLKLDPDDICYHLWVECLCAGANSHSKSNDICNHCVFLSKRDGKPYNSKGESEYSKNLKLLEKMNKLEL
jgi:hypothetical protein